jgi:hypothetical protein
MLFEQDEKKATRTGGFATKQKGVRLVACPLPFSSSLPY